MAPAPPSSSSRQGASLSVAALVAVLLSSRLPGTRADDWIYGRSSYYGNDGGATIHEGSCMFGYLDKNKGTGWDIAALSDSNWDFDKSCGRCYEVQCRRDKFRDGYGQELDRSSPEHCPDESKSVIVRITDACPCYYPGNQYSNKRWCCGDQQHMDMSWVAFEKLSPLRFGVVGARWRRVSCPSGTPGNSWQNDKRNQKGDHDSY